MDLELKGKIALVTGASTGIGREIAKVLAAEGAQTVIIARRGNLLATLQDEIEKSGGSRPLAITADLYESSAPLKIRDQVLKHFGYIDILVNNVGRGLVFKDSSYDQMEFLGESNTDRSEALSADLAERAWEKSFAINLLAGRRMTQAFLPVMQRRKWGRIINITGSFEPKAANPTNAAKAGMHAWAKGLSREIAKDGITVNCVQPGHIRSEQVDTRLFPSPEKRAHHVNVIPIGFFGEPSDMAYMVVFLCSPKARYITGERISVDGGMHYQI